MSKAVLTGPLLDFGSSFWTTDLVSSEFPGLKATGFKSAGKFGIGFYACFMIAEEVIVNSRKYTDGLSSANRLLFRQGLSLRPQLVEGSTLESTTYTTEIHLKIKDEKDELGKGFDFGTNYIGNKALKVDFKTVITHIAQYSGVSIYYDDGTGEENIISSSEIKKPVPTELDKFNSARFPHCKLSDDQVTQLSENLRPIDPNHPELE